MSTLEDPYLVFAKNILAVYPSVVLFVQGGTVLTFAEVYFSLAWVDFGVFSNIINSAFENSPTVIFSVMLGDFLLSVKDTVRIFHHSFHLLAVLNEP